MSKDLTAAKRYAKALYEASKEQGKVDEAIAEMQAAASVLENNPDMALVLTHPNIDASAKTDLIRGVFEGKLSDIVLNILVLLVERKRTELIPAVSEQFVRIADESLGRAEAVVYSPKTLSPQETSSIAERFTSLTGKTIHVSNIVDESLLGGIKVRIGDKLYDGSLSGKLKRLEKALQASQAL
jgi:F-type H+-transporting ATPase subunit delta